MKEGERLLDRMGAMLKLRTMHKQVASGKLRELSYIGENLADSARVNAAKGNLYKELQNRYRDDIAKDDALYRQFNALKADLRRGDPAAFKRLERTAQALSISNPTSKSFSIAGTLLSANLKNVDGFYVTSILSGPLTQSRNFWGNFYQTIGHPLLAYTGQALPGKTNQTVRYQAVAALGATHETFKEITDLFPRLMQRQRQAVDLNLKDYSVWDEQLEMNMTRIKAMAEAGELGWAQQASYALAINLRKALEAPFMRPIMDMMGSVDSFFQIVAARQVAARRAVEDALKDMGDAPLTGNRAQKFGDLVTQFKEYHTKNVLSDDGITLIDDEAKHLAQTFTFQTPISEADPFTKKLNELSSVPLMKTLGLTFVKTPSAILKASANLTPGLSTLLKHSDEMYRNGSDYYRAMRDGAEAMSYFIGSSAYLMGATGIATGAGPLRGDARDNWLMSNKPYTITLPGGIEFNYQSLEPAATVIGLFADMGSLGFGGRSENENVWAAIPGAIMSNVVNKSYLTQLSTMAQIVNLQSASDIKRVGENIARGLVPYSGMRNQTGQVVDTALREVRSQIEPTWSWFLKKNGGLGSTAALPQRLDPVTGKGLTRDGVEGPGSNLLGLINNFAPLGIRFSKERFEKVHQLLESEGVDIDNDVRKLNAQDMTNEEMTEYTRFRAGDGALKKDLLDYFYSRQYTEVDKPESDRQRREGVDVSETYAHQNLMAIVRMHHDKAVAQMELGLTDVSSGFAERRKKVMQGAADSERQYNKTSRGVTLQNYPF
jgi:hypothetical protein